MVDNARHQRQIDLKEVTWRRVLDVNDRQLRNIVTGLGGSANGTPSEAGFDITAASELMAVLCLATDLDDLRARIDRLVLGIKRDGSAFTCAELGATGSVMALLLDAMKPNLVQTLEGTPALVHGGPFANIAHGCNSVVATLAAMKLGEYAITEAGFGSDLGAEKFYDIKCRHAGLRPAAVVLVTSLKALKWHGGVALPEIGKPNMEALKAGLCNLDAHIANLKAFGPEIVVSMNHFYNDPEDEIAVLRARCEELGVRFAISDGFAKGGEGAESVAKEVLEAAAASKGELHFTVEDEDPIAVKVEKIAKRVYGAGVEQDGFVLRSCQEGPQDTQRHGLWQSSCVHRQDSLLADSRPEGARCPQGLRFAGSARDSQRRRRFCRRHNWSHHAYAGSSQGPCCHAH